MTEVYAVKQMNAETILSHDTKVMKLAGVRLHRNLDRGHMRTSRAVMAPGDEPLYSLLFPFYHGLHIAIGAVPHPAQ